MSRKNLILFTIILIVWSCCVSAQTYTFTNTSNPLSAGKFSCTGQYTLEFDFTADTGTHKFANIKMFTWGSQSASIQYPYLTYDGWQIPLTGSIGYPLMIAGTHHWTFRIGSGLQQVVIDKYIIASKTYTGTVTQNADLIFSDSWPYYKLSGIISFPRVINSFMRTLNEITSPAGVYDWRNFPPGYVAGDYDNTPPLYDQLKAMCGLIKYSPDFTYPKIHPFFDFFRAGGERDLTVSTDSAIKAGVMIAKLLCDSFNCSLRVIGNTQDYISYKDQPQSPHGKFNNAMIQLSNDHPGYEISVDCSISHLENVPGYNALTDPQKMALLPSDDVSKFDGYAGILKYHYTTIQAKLSRKIDFSICDNEFPNQMLDSGKNERNASCNAAKIASGLSWWDYTSVSYTKFFKNAYSGILAACPAIKFDEYDVHALDECREMYHSKFKYRITNSTSGYGTPQFYPRSNFYALVGAGDHRGLRYQLRSKRGEIKAGHGLNTPFYGMGYTGVPENCVTPTQAIGLATFMTVAGAPTSYPALFIEGTENPNTKGYAWQMVYATIAQAACSPAWDIIMNGTLLEGDHSIAWACFGGTDYSFWFGSVEAPCVVRQLGHRYAIAAVNTTLTGFKPGVPYKFHGGITLNGKYLEMDARPMCSVYEYNDMLPYQPDQKLAYPNPKMINQWVKFGDPQNWSSRLNMGDN